MSVWCQCFVYGLVDQFLNSLEMAVKDKDVLVVICLNTQIGHNPSASVLDKLMSAIADCSKLHGDEVVRRCEEQSEQVEEPCCGK